MSNAGRSRTGLQLIFAFFLGLMVTAFIGVGVYTFYADGMEPFEDERATLNDRQSDIREARGSDGFTTEEQQELDAIEGSLRDLQERRDEQWQRWARNTSVILIIFATLAMGISLVRADQLPVINNGLLLGGVFTMLYGTGWILASGESRMRFWVMLCALVITLVLGYLRFVRERVASRAVVAPAGAEAPSGEVLARLEALERRLDAAAEGLRGGERDQ